MPVSAIWIINKTGGLVYQKAIPGNCDHINVEGAGMHSAMILYTLHAISSKISPHPDSGGFECITSPNLKIFVYESPTKTKFVIITDNNFGDDRADQMLRGVYLAYCDYVLKNPFVRTEHTLRCPLFDERVLQLLS